MPDEKKGRTFRIDHRTHRISEVDPVPPLDSAELTLLLKLLNESPYKAEYADTADKLTRMIQKSLT